MSDKAAAADRYTSRMTQSRAKRAKDADGGGSRAGLQGEFGIGLLSFRTVGETLTMTSTGADQRAYQMVMSKGDRRCEDDDAGALFALVDELADVGHVSIREFPRRGPRQRGTTLIIAFSASKSEGLRV